MENNQFDREVKSKFEDFTPPVALDLWSKIDNQLNIQESKKIIPVKGRRFSFLVYGSIAATVLIAFAFWKLYDPVNLPSKKDPVAYISEIPIEGISSQKDKDDNTESYQKKVLPEVDRFAGVHTQKVPFGKVDSKPAQEAAVKLKTNTITENEFEEGSFGTINSEPSHSKPTEILAFAENAPFDNGGITVLNSLPLQEEADLIDGIDHSKNKKLGVSVVLNFLAKGLANGNAIEFSESDEGILKLDVKWGLAKSKN